MEELMSCVCASEMVNYQALDAWKEGNPWNRIRWAWDYLRDKLLRRVLRPASVSKQEFSRAETLRWSFIWRLHPMGYFSPVTSVSMGCSIPYASSRRQLHGNGVTGIEVPWSVGYNVVKGYNMPTLYSKQPMITGWFLKVK